MRLLLALAAYAALTVAGFAQAPREIPVQNTIHLQPGEIKAFQIARGFNKIEAPGKNIEIVVDSDNSFTIRGIAPGISILTAYTPSGDIAFRGFVSVGGSAVKIYGTQRNRSDYVGYVCTSFTCSRANPDMDRKPNSESFSITTRDADGNILTTTQQYQ